MEDERFSHVIYDPKFRRIPKTERKVKIDKRFKSMFKDKQFKLKYTVDKRGRPVNHTSNEDLKRYYELDSDASSIESEEESGKYVKALQAPIDTDDDNNELNLQDKTDNQLSDEVKKRLKNLKVDYARGESNLFSDSSSDDEESESDKEEDVEHAWGALDNDAERTDEITHRFAACNMDWDRIRAVDLMVLLNSFLLPGQVIKSVTIYPSEFGKKRMKEEELKGPVELVESKPLQNEEEEEEENEEGSKFHMEKLRQYQLNRLKYYFAVIVCDNKDTANKIYIECDGLEYESSATKMDLRFIPDDMTFDDEPKEICNKLPEEGKYKPRFFTTTALQQAKVDLTWDETDPDRNEFIQKLATGSEIENNHLEAYLASSSEESPEEDAPIYNDDEGTNSKLSAVDKYKLLLQDIENKEKDKEKKGVEMEISWELNVKDNTEKLVKKKLEEKEETTPFQQYLDKRKEKQKVKRNKNKQRHTSEGGDDSDFSLDVDMNDPYFAEEFNNPEFKQSKKKTSKIKNGKGDNENKQKEAELELLLLNAEDDKNHFSLEKILNNENQKKSKRKSQKNEVEDTVDDFKIDVRDARFSALYSSHHYNIDPTDPRYRKTKAVDAILNEKLKRRNEEHVEESTYNRSNGDAELRALVKSVQNKTKVLDNRKRFKNNPN